MKRFFGITTIGLTTLLVLAEIPRSGAIAEGNSLMAAQERLLFNPPPPSSPAPASRSAGITRGDSCPGENTPEVVALVPQTGEKNKEQAWGTTVSEHPTVWFYIPYGSKKFPKVSFRLLLQQKIEGKVKNRYRTLAQGTAKQPQGPGIVPVQFSSAIALNVNESYQWSLAITCGDETVEATGWIKRVKPAQLAPSGDPALQQALQHLKNGVWYDGLTILGTLRRTKPGDAEVDRYWKALLAEIGLEKIADQAISPPVTVEPFKKE